MRSLMELVYCLLSIDWKKNQQSKTYGSYRLVAVVGLVTGKIITSANSRIISKVKFF